MHQIEVQRMQDEDAAYEAWAAEHADALDAEAKAAWVESLCEGHESLRGDLMGATDFCDGTCRPASERDDDAYLVYLEGALPDD